MYMLHAFQNLKYFSGSACNIIFSSHYYSMLAFIMTLPSRHFGPNPQGGLFQIIGLFKSMD